tara:strand:- start:1143 stop:1376 length:234 start_codon:yes stop_codon:yes gene_type:complete
MKTITQDQYRHLQGFFFALSCHYLEGIKTNFGHWSNLLDDRGIPWNIQNSVSELAQYKINTGFYLSTLLKEKGIAVL